MQDLLKYILSEADPSMNVMLLIIAYRFVLILLLFITVCVFAGYDVHINKKGIHIVRIKRNRNKTNSKKRDKWK